MSNNIQKYALNIIKTVAGGDACQQYIYEVTLRTLNLFVRDTAHKQCLAFHERPSMQGTVNH